MYNTARVIGKHHLANPSLRGFQMTFSKREDSDIQCKQALMILLHLLNCVFRYCNNMMTTHLRYVDILPSAMNPPIAKTTRTSPRM